MQGGAIPNGNWGGARSTNCHEAIWEWSIDIYIYTYQYVYLKRFISSISTSGRVSHINIIVVHAKGQHWSNSKTSMHATRKVQWPSTTNVKNMQKTIYVDDCRCTFVYLLQIVNHQQWIQCKYCMYLEFRKSPEVETGFDSGSDWPSNRSKLDSKLPQQIHSVCRFSTVLFVFICYVLLAIDIRYTIIYIHILTYIISFSIICWYMFGWLFLNLNSLHILLFVKCCCIFSYTAICCYYRYWQIIGLQCMVFLNSEVGSVFIPCHWGR